MSRRRLDSEEWENEQDDREDPDDSDVDDSEREESIECPACGREIYEGAEQCPRCGQYLSEEEETQRAGKPVWIWVGIILAMMGMLGWVLW